ncbi:ammonium transporter [Methylosinus sp. C49]|uniref:ammonium transporter n=1 Tax=Methylosinus sp. C49 TaxID=2699395 RepID=UPI00136712F4|nr:ammonium transporter [Methylosinus sp. C49]BBU63139.1 ammonium transporter [Methylosinus sp. C49]
MRLRLPRSLSAASTLVGAAIAAGLADPALAAGNAPVPNPGDTAWVLISSALVLMMSVPGLALFYGGLVRSKNMLSVLTQTFAIVALVGVVWTLYGYSLAFGDGGSLNAYIGGFNKLLMKGVDASSNAPTFTPGHVIPEYAYFVFQMTFAMITPALIIGAFAERIKFSAAFVFVLLWVTIIYFPVAHWVWGVADPNALVDAATKLAAAGTEEAKTAAQGEIDTLLGSVGWIAGGLAPWMHGTGALDFAGGTVVHINAGIAGFVGALILGKRIGYGKEALPPHSLTLSMVGASLLWVGWFGFNAGSNLEANGTTALAFVNTMVATAAAALSWLLTEWALKGKPSLLGLISGAVAGLVAVTPASGFAGPIGSIALGFIVSPISLFFVSKVKNLFGYDDSLDVFGVHAIGGITGALATGILVSPDLGGVGITDYTNIGENFAGKYDMAQQMISQATAVGATILYSGVGSAILYKIVDVVIGLRVAPDQEREGLDIAEHGERAYNY